MKLKYEYQKNKDALKKKHKYNSELIIFMMLLVSLITATGGLAEQPPFPLQYICSFRNCVATSS